METVLTIFQTATPVGVIGLLAYIIYLLVQAEKGQTKIAENHLHDLPEMVETLRRVEGLMARMNEHLVYIRARINGHDR